MRARRLTPVTTDPYTQPAVAIPWPSTDEGPARSLPHAAPGHLRRILVAGVGYRNLRDLSAGPELIERLRVLEWAPSVQVEDLSYGAVHVMHWLQEQASFDATVIVASVARGRPPGTVTCSKWRTPGMVSEVVQQSIAEAVTGVISLDTLLTVLAYFGVLPPTVITVELEPRDEDWGPQFSPLVQDALDMAVRTVQSQVEALLR